MRQEYLQHVRRIVVKVGTGVLTNDRNLIDPDRMKLLVLQLAEQRLAGKEIVLVTSGAAGTGMGVLGYAKRPGHLDLLQACAAVGQSRLMAQYDSLFQEHGLQPAQVLLTHEDLRHKERHINARNTLVKLLQLGVVPIVNENDAVSFTELKFGDNDKLSALAACLLPADLLVILTSVDGVIENFGKEDQRVLPVIQRIDDPILRLAGATQSQTSVGGMITKVEAARIAVRSGIPMVIASGLRPGVLARVLCGEEEGTLFVPGKSKLKGRKRWIAFFHHPAGAFHVDDGAKAAIRDQGKSLLFPGILRCEGPFRSGDVVRVCDSNGMEFARGVAAFGSEEMGSGKTQRAEAIHRDNLVLL